MLKVVIIPADTIYMGPGFDADMGRNPAPTGNRLSHESRQKLGDHVFCYS